MTVELVAVLMNGVRVDRLFMLRDKRRSLEFRAQGIGLRAWSEDRMMTVDEKAKFALLVQGIEELSRAIASIG
jgi:hypothetical protein